MNATNRVTNRVVLFLAGAALLIAGASSLAAGLLEAGDPPVWAEGGLAAVSEAWASTARRTVEIAGVGAVPVALLIAAAAVLLLTALLLVFVFTRGGGRSNDVLAIDAEGGRTTVDRDVADAILTAPLAARTDVISARVNAYRVRRTQALELAVIVQPGASLDAVLAAAETAVSDWDDLLGTRIPIMLHLSDRRWRDALRPRVRVQ
ncbi:hypothetical protein [Microbacterium sp. SA39]|uniref:hypothetical protein n=1 Tax=Microbacterium sp. SA39 TaxID=1263625 RepID=UPI0005F9BBDB|nr:hypothetical protein [Microbacterium sp. SA39]KJQ55116.1 hypothetical protein RS85_01176 [Microbacterium sp. SA39]